VRDPLARVPIRYKLSAGFVGLCLLAYGVGAGLVSSAARDALHAQIRDRLRADARARASRIEASLGKWVARAKDFASDGLVRAEAERLAGAGDAATAEDAVQLRDHLERNKLAIARPVVVDLLVCDERGRSLAQVLPSVPGRDAFVAGVVSGATPHVSGFAPPASPGASAAFGLAAPILALDGGRRVGWLVFWVDADAWIADGASLEEGSADAAVVRLLDAEGRGVEATAGDSAAALRRHEPGSRDDVPAEPLAYRWPLAGAAWSVEVRTAAGAFAPVEGLESRLLGAGLLVAAATAVLLFFPLRFLVRPLAALRDAAKRISEGDLSHRVEIASRDEVGDLAQAFNRMADAVRDRTRRLEQAARDLEARKDDLARERNRLDAMVHSMQDALVFYDDGGRVLLSNAAAAPLLPVLTGPAGTDLARRCGAATDDHARDCVSCLARGDLPRQSCRLEVAGRVYEVRATRIPSVGGWLGRLLVARDITDLVTVDERQARQERLAVLGEVAAVVAHELNNPLSAVAMYAQMMEDELPPDSPFREHVAVVRRNVETASHAIRGILDWSHAAEPEVADVDLSELVEEAVGFVRPLLRRAGAELVVRDEVSDPALQADGVMLRQVLVNLLLNAIQAVEGRGRRVEVVTGEEDGGRTLVVDVADDGPGVPPDRRERIFEPFFTTKPAGKGTGLGLSISRRIAESHGGTLALESAEPGRTVFRMRLPRRAMVVSRRALAGVHGARLP
jgi:signal transduction histidine kinase